MCSFKLTILVKYKGKKFVELRGVKCQVFYDEKNCWEVILWNGWKCKQILPNQFYLFFLPNQFF